MVHLDVAVSPAGVQAAHSKAIKTVNKEISIPGFRKGKAPESLVVQQFGKYVKQEWHQILINTAFNEFLEKTKLYPLTTTQKSIKRAEVKNADMNNGAQLVLEYEGKPEVPAIDLSHLVLKGVKREAITADDVNDTIHQIQLHHAEWTPVTDRPVQEGDFVDLTIDALESPPRNICTQMHFEVAPGKMATWMRNLIIGHNAHDTVEGTSEKEAGQEIPDFIPTQCRIVINNIKTAVLPPLDNELAKKVGLNNIDDLPSRVEADLNRKADAEVKEQLRAQAEDIILKNYPFEIPRSLIEKQHKEVMDQKVREMSKNEESPEKMVETVKKLESEINEELERAYRLFFISRKLADENQIQVYENEVMNEMMRQLRLPPGQGIIDLSMNPEDAKSKLYVNVLSQKVLDFLVSKASIKEE
jgi:trigger factor